MQLIPINDELNEFSMDFYLKGNDEFHFAVCDQNALDNGAALDFKQSNNKEVSGNIKSNGEPKSYYIALKSINEKVEINVSLAPRPVDMTPKPEAPPQQQRPPPQQQRPPPQQQRPPPQQQRPPPQQQQRLPPQQQRPPPQQQQRPPPQQQRPPPQQQQRPPPQQQRGMMPPPQQRQAPRQRGMPPRQRPPPQNRMPSKPVSKGHHHEHNELKLERGMPANVKMWCLGGVTVILLGTVVWYFISRSSKRASKKSSPALEDVVETASTIAAEASDVVNSSATEVLSGGSDLLSKLKALPSSSRSRSRV